MQKVEKLCTNQSTLELKRMLFWNRKTISVNKMMASYSYVNWDLDYFDSSTVFFTVSSIFDLTIRQSIYLVTKINEEQKVKSRHWTKGLL